MKTIGTTLGGYTREQVGEMLFSDAISLCRAEGYSISALEQWFKDMPTTDEIGLASQQEVKA